MKTLLIVFHSLTGGTRQMAEAAARGAEAQAEVSVRLLPAVEAQPADVLSAEGYVFAAPETFTAISGLMRDLFDRTEEKKVSPLKWPSCRGGAHG